MSAKWTFKEGTREGFTAGAVTIFQGARLQSTIRETVQNSLDACADSDKPVKICYDMTTLDLASCNEIMGLRDFLVAALGEEQKLASVQDLDESGEKQNKSQSSQAVDFYVNAIDKVLAARHIRILGIHDFNTSGLGGNLREVENEKPGQWLALIKGAGVDVKKDADALGSFGQGAKAPFALSELRTLFYLSKVPHEAGVASKRFQGKALLSSFWQKNDGGLGTLRIGTGFFGIGIEQDAIENEQIPGWATSSREAFGKAAHEEYSNDFGTSIFLPSPVGADAENIEEFKKAIKVVLLTNFYFALKTKKLEIDFFHEEVIDSSNCELVADELGLLDSTDDSAWDPITLDKIETLRTLVKPAHEGVLESTSFGTCVWSLRLGESVSGRTVGIARKTGMLITRKPMKFLRFPGTANFDLFICVTGKEGSQVLRSFENPAHDTFEEDRISDPDKLEKALKKYNKFVTEVRDQIINKYAQLTTETEVLTDDLNDLLAGELSDQEKGENLIDFTSRVKIVAGSRRAQGRPRAVPGLGRRRYRSGGTKRSRRKTGFTSEMAQNAENLVFVPKLGNQSARVYFDYYDAIEAEGSLIIYRSGDLESSLVRRIPIENAKLVDGSPNRYWVTVENLDDYTGAIEASIVKPLELVDGKESSTQPHTTGENNATQV